MTWWHGINDADDLILGMIALAAIVAFVIGCIMRSFNID